MPPIPYLLPRSQILPLAKGTAAKARARAFVWRGSQMPRTIRSNSSPTITSTPSLVDATRRHWQLKTRHAARPAEQITASQARRTVHLGAGLVRSSGCLF